MSFFGFDTSLPRDKPGGGSKGIFEHSNPFNEVAKARKLQAFQDNEQEILNFEDTYDGLGDRLQETGDDFNDDTFGGGAEGGNDRGAVGRDFDFFGNTAQVSDAIEQEQVRYGLQLPAAHMSVPMQAPKPKRTGYERYQDPGFIPDIQAKSGAWGSKAQAEPEAAQARISTARPVSQPPAPVEPPRMMSLEEVEAALLAQQQQQQQQQQWQQHQHQHQQHHHQPFPQPQHQPHPFPMQQMQPPPQPFPQMPPPGPVQQQPPPPPASPQRRHNRMPSQPQPRPQQPLQILQNPNRAHHSPQPSQDRVPPAGPGSMPVITNPQQLMDLSNEQRRVYLEEDAKRAKRNHKIFLLSKGNGLMTPQDKNFITRIQLQQLVAATGSSADSNPEETLNEDFYYQVYSQIRGAPRQHPTQPLGHFAQTYLFQTGNRVGGRRQQVNGDNHMQRMQLQVQRAVEAAKLKPKNKQLIIEGSLGKISFSNAKTPKPLLNIKRQESTDARPASARKGAPSDRKSILRNIEAVYSTLMRLEDNERQMPPPPTEGDADSIQAHLEWRQKMQELNAKLWQDLKILEPIVPGSSVTHPFIAFLSFAKSKKAVPRIFHQIDQEQRVTMLTMIIVHLDQLDVVRDARLAPGDSQPPLHVREEIELFSQAVMPCLMGYVSEAPVNIVIGLLGLLLDHTNVIQVVHTKIGLAMMTMLLTRAEIVKESGVVADQEWQQWTTLYNRLFDVLEPVLGSIFPAAVNAGDDMYVWQFLAAVGVGASPEQQQRLVIGVKDRVMETVQQSKALPPDMSSVRLGNVNLFMRAIGLDVEMLG
ncbi:DNA topoisomerase 2-associated protein pat1 [Exophiala xenobiotica]|uniref:DNA topoisomerase 2-associated protein pat1 n=1 Tax=Vermiconidia calcicola TaxID=1690605 RepID=A0AAV9QF33_9PEZI|nr:DNA topoisomerase 2-associated protein pat1 [Exophiala xenobiotica]KAK5529609.1 DNA topoisomerase 2-associated protein pat1 [Chaetothyriales sp. CCFEE 6169]KAK5539533.1 DNA topoisomerase 2-associated protein pat1 [Vermiconidia calcicola]KAK5303797.1 DNA topoisomerase 2-associated protein pat1 [Exophiala xenobiotica]KAK5319188.1 DNA topoisomerase 2-associated protein pat1 [Exophiala xenobiotica]